MVINNTIITELEHTYRRHFPYDLKKYLLATYSEEPFPYEYTEQDLYTQICNDIEDYEAVKLDVTVKSPSERWQEDREYLQKLYIERSYEVQDLEEYIVELERILSDHDLESSKMAQRRIENTSESPF